jgi:DNA polymerase-3 subunit alpha
LRVHTEFSLVDSVVRVPQLIEAVASAGMPAVALTDESNLFAMVKFYRAALARGVKPLIGVDLRLREPGERAQPTRLTLLCQNSVGYGNLTRLVTRAYLEGQDRGQPRIDRAWLTPATTSGLIALSGGLEGDVGRALANARLAEAERALEYWRALFGDRYYLELQRLGRAGDAEYVAAAVEIAARSGTPVVATNDVRFLVPTDFESHEARVCIHEGTLLGDAARPRRYSREQYLRQSAEMEQLFADLPEALANSVEIAKRCSLALTLGAARLPEFQVPDGISVDEFLRAEAVRGLDARLARALALSAAPATSVSPKAAVSRPGVEPDLAPERYTERLHTELAVIGEMGFQGYFLIVADFIRWARNHGVPVGPGRGSGAGSVVAWSLGITDIDPLRYDLLFERFLNPERVSMPDFDVDFCMEGRDRVIDYVADKYGRERVSQIITYGTMAAKAVVRDVGRVLGLSYGYVDRIAKLIPFELGITLEDALSKEPELKRLYRSEDEVRNLIDLARSLEGLTRNAGTHAGGVVIAPSRLTDFAPLYCEEGATSVVTQFDKDDVEAAGLVKFDFLGLRTLTIIDRAVRIIDRLRSAAGQEPLDVSALPMDDAPTYQLLKACATTAVFQLESRGMKDLIRRLQPDCFEDIIALVALFRPGPLQSGMVDDFINRKHGRIDAPVDYLHPSLQVILAPTYGVILYQEQVMQIAQVLAGYTLGGADLLRRAMGKKKPEEMATQRSVFIAGATRNGVETRQAAHIFDLMEKFAGYGFNKSHSAAYALLSYQTAWLKAHYPAAFMAAVLSADMDFTDKVVTLIDECQSMGLVILPPDVNESVHEFAVADARTLRYGLGAIKGVGQGAVEALVAERTARGPFATLEDLCRRLDPARLGRRVVEALIRSGSLDRIGPNRATLWNRVSAALQLGEQNSRAQGAGQVDFFGLAATESSAVEWTEAQRLAGERETLGLYLTGHPIARFEKDLARFATGRIADFASDRPPGAGSGGGGGGGGWGEGRGFGGGGKAAMIAGLIHEIRKRGTRTSAILDDRTGRIEVTFFDEIFHQHRDLVVKDALVLIEGQLRFDEFSDAWRLAARKVTPLERLREQQARRILVRWPPGAGGTALIERLAEALTPWRPGPCPLTIVYGGDLARVNLTLGAEWSVRVTAGLVDALEALVGREALQILYDPHPGTSSSALG